MTLQQSTLKKDIHIQGIGLHSGEQVSLTLSPAPANSGIVFYLHKSFSLKPVSYSVPYSVPKLSPNPYAVATTELATTLKIQNSSLSTVEHLLAAIHAFHIDNIHIHIHNTSTHNEVPILDGSASVFYRAFKSTGKEYLPYTRAYAKITENFEYTQGNKSIKAQPYDGLYIDYTIDFNHPLIGKQNFKIDLTPSNFSEIASARTFGFMKEVEYLHAKGLALGGSLDNAIILGENEVLNPSGLRYKDEFVRHKVLDFVGDIAMLGSPLQGAFEVHYSGHQHNNLFLRKLTQSHALKYVQAEKIYHTLPHFLKPAIGLAFS